MCKFKGVLSANVIKIIALISMTVDHIGLILFPNILWLRIVGRIAFPLYAYFIAEGCRYTRNKTKYLSTILLLGLLCCFFEYMGQGRIELNILLTFSFSIVLIYCIQWLKKGLGNNSSKQVVSRFAVCFTVFVLIFFVSLYLSIITGSSVDYGFCGILLPVFISLFDSKGLKLLMFALGQVFLCVFELGSSIQWFGLISCGIMLLYNGKIGRYKLKYLFYIYYPLHLNVLWIISFII